MTTITHHPDGTVTARDEDTGIEGTAHGSIHPGVAELVARRRLAEKLAAHERERQDAALRREMG